MTSTSQKNIIQQILIFTSFIIILLILWNTYVFFQKFKEEERIKMEIWAAAEAELIKTTDLNKDLGDLPLEVLRNNKSTPMIFVHEDGTITSNNLDADDEDREYLLKKIEKFKKQNYPVTIAYGNEKYGTLYYGNSEVLRKLKYYPIALILIIVLFGSVVFFFYRTSKISDQNKLWAGMAKETAHQIGTPLSSLLGWVEILKSEKTDPSITSEIEKDIDRLKIITERFSKIGSMPSLEKREIVAETRKTFQYIEARSSKMINFTFISPEKEFYSDINPQLFSWTIENLIKNAIDAMKGKGSVKVEILDSSNEVKINISDTGKGILKKNYSKIFDPGYTTKKRGWGLGLSLVRRIIEDYHRGKVRVLESKIGKGTTMQIILKTTEK
ncbi:sensor histidine kinase [Abyssalbus ytuae]|uniref:histidine kinase n=1 Tax=Abyssalbus ytuae TaxID=2926907 RepID=A0A9E6ZQX5_9FLAO|nr:HAMP domain-containing sensor histidine kinase [Abyssalbus ytuae]UOB16258.1 HAMP domain-containing histidine kinase [Abyssalbus ytuae]